MDLSPGERRSGTLLACREAGSGGKEFAFAETSGRSLKLAAFAAFAGPLDPLTRYARRSSPLKGRVGRACQLSIPPNKPHQLALDLDPVGAIEAGFICRIGGLQRDGVAATAQPLQGRLFIVHQGDNDLACVGGVGFLDNDGIAVQNAGIDHGIAGDFQRIMIAAADHAAGHRHVAHFVLQSLDRRAGGDTAHQGDIDGGFSPIAITASRCGDPGIRHADVAAPMTAAGALDLAAGGGGTQGLGHIVGKFEHFQRPRPLFHTAQEATLFQGGDQAVDAGFGFQVQRLFHLIEGRRNAGFAHPLVNEHQQLVLFAGQHAVFLPRRNGWFGPRIGRAKLLRFFNNGVEVDINGRPIASKEPTVEPQSFIVPDHEPEVDLDTLKDHQKSVWDQFIETPEQQKARLMKPKRKRSVSRKDEEVKPLDLVVDPTLSELSTDPNKLASADVDDLVRDSLKEREKTLSAASVLMGFLSHPDDKSVTQKVEV